MKKTYPLLILATILALVLSACGAPTPAPDTMMDKPTDDMMMHETPTPDEMMHEMPTSDGMMEDGTATPQAMMDETPAWFGVALTDARTGQTFSINGLKGKVVLVETMAQWCTNCFQQQKQVKALHDMIGANEDFVSIGLDIDPNENAADLKKYVESRGFDWLYAVPPADVAREIGNLYTAQFLNPPSTPILIVDRQGVAHPLPFGIKSADSLASAVMMYLEE